ncbi:MAG TPA: metallophosphoesterase [Bryobacteraceae bacterium]|nr:metallophosphoesterase [Bryobacteraceae bacterium]
MLISVSRLAPWLCAALIAGHAVAEDKLVGGPYAVNVGPRSATVVWVFQTGQVTLHGDGAKPDMTAPVLRSEKVHFTGLEPGKTYTYDSQGGPGAKGSFTTAPAPNSTAPFEFVVYGDTRTRHEMHRKVVAAILKYATPQFVLHTGDLVADGADSAQWPVFFDIERELLRKAAFFPSLGNHERNNRQYYDFFDVSTPYYSFNWGEAHFIVLNSDIGNVSQSELERNAFWSEQSRWLEEDLAKSQSAAYRFVFAHHPPLTAVARRQGDNPHMTALMPMFEKYKLTAGFFGHDHNYQHYLNNGVHYFITGGGGAPLYDVDKPPEGITKMVVSTEHFLDVKIDGSTVRVEAIKLDGQPLETTTITAAPATR